MKAKIILEVEGSKKEIDDLSNKITKFMKTSSIRSNVKMPNNLNFNFNKRSPTRKWKV